MYKYIHGIYKNYLICHWRTHHIIGERDRDRHRCAADTLIHSELSACFKDKQYIAETFLRCSPSILLWDIWDPYLGLTSILPGYNVQDWLSGPILKVRILPIWPLSCFPWFPNVSRKCEVLETSASWAVSFPAPLPPAPPHIPQPHSSALFSITWIHCDSLGTLGATVCPCC